LLFADVAAGSEIDVNLQILAGGRNQHPHHPQNLNNCFCLKAHPDENLHKNSSVTFLNNPTHRQISRPTNTNQGRNITNLVAVLMTSQVSALESD